LLAFPRSGFRFAVITAWNTASLFSDLPLAELERLIVSAKARQASRPLLEAAAALDPVIADFVYIVDHKLAARGHVITSNCGTNMLNTWHSFGRPEIISLQERMARHAVDEDAVLLLPCSRQRPYSASRTHARLLQLLANAGHDPHDFSRVVVTALGVVPEAYWCEPLVMTYDAGAVDLWRVFQILRSFFQINRFRTIVDCLSFKPYSDMLRTLHQLGSITKPVRPFKLRWRGFHVNLP
jgi:predicted RNA-binding protein